MSPVTFQISCPGCGKTKSAKREWVGKTANCECGERFTITLKQQETETDRLKSPTDNGGLLMQFFYRWNAFQIAAFTCWLLGALFICFPAVQLYTQADNFMPGSFFQSQIVAILIGIVLLATGGTLHKIGSGREIRTAERRHRNNNER
ncbi:hypothetical protein OAH18_00530 [bacterium]|nr:hypothetical protein [bacterium]